MRARSRVPAAWAFVVLGLVLGTATCVIALSGCGGEPFSEQQWTKPWATDEEVVVWHEEWDRRAAPWVRIPDPPGQGPVETARYWVSRQAYEMEVRRRGDRITLEIHGVDEQEFGGGWSAFGEGRIEGPASGFAGAVATFTWSCLGIRYRTASDGLGRIQFTDDGGAMGAIYVSHEASEVWFKSYGRRADGRRPERGTLKGQIPFAGGLSRLPPDVLYDVDLLVTDEWGTPLVSAVAGLKGVEASRVVTDRSGRARVRFFGREAAFAQAFDAGMAGYYNGETIAFTGDEHPGLVPGGVARETVHVMLLRADLTDHPEYTWNHPARSADPDDAMACATCHGWHYDEFLSSRHARSADNGLVQAEHARMQRYNEDAPSDMDAPDDCSGCHTPGRAAEARDETLRRGGMLAANHCDFCHKIQRVTDLRQSGVFGALELARPDPASFARPGGIQQVFGTSPDATYAYMGAIYNPLFASSHLCAACHQGGGRWRDGLPPKVDTFEEWRAWAVVEGAATREVKSCQDCHMPGASTLDVDGNAVDQIAWDAQHRGPEQLHSHRFHGRDPELARSALDVKVEKQRVEGDTPAWVVTVRVTNTGAGHRIPTGTWTKHVVIGVWARGDDGWLSPVEAGSDLLPTRVGSDEATFAPGDWSETGGTILGMDAGSDTRPTFWAPWNPEDLVDRRLAPGETREVHVVYAGDREPEVEVRIVHRRGEMGAGAENLSFPLRAYDAQPEVEWLRIRR